MNIQSSEFFMDGQELKMTDVVEINVYPHFKYMSKEGKKHWRERPSVNWVKKRRKARNWQRKVKAAIYRYLMGNLQVDKESGEIKVRISSEVRKGIETMLAEKFPTIMSKWR